MMDGKTVRNMYGVIPKINKFETLVHLVGFTIEIATSKLNLKLTRHVLFSQYCTSVRFYSVSATSRFSGYSCRRKSVGSPRDLP